MFAGACALGPLSPVRMETEPARTLAPGTRVTHDAPMAPPNPPRSAPPAVPLAYQTPGTPAERFTHVQYLIRRKVFKILGAAFHVYDTAGNVVLYSKQKAWKFKEDIRLYSSDDMTVELLTIQARQIIDFGASYDVVDTPSGQKVGTFRRKGLKSLIRDEWIIMDGHDRP